MGSRGAFAESAVNLMLRRLEAEGQVVMRPTHPGTSVDSQGRRFFVSAGAPDFLGALRGGRAFVFDVKSTVHKSWTWTTGAGRRARTKDRQIADIEAFGRTGALAGILVFFTGPEVVQSTSIVWVPWQQIRVVASGSWTPDRLNSIPSVRFWWQPGSNDPALLAGIQELDRKLLLREETDVLLVYPRGVGHGGA